MEWRQSRTVKEVLLVVDRTGDASVAFIVEIPS